MVMNMCLCVWLCVYCIVFIYMCVYLYKMRAVHIIWMSIEWLRVQYDRYHYTALSSLHSTQTYTSTLALTSTYILIYYYLLLL